MWAERCPAGPGQLDLATCHVRGELREWSGLTYRMAGFRETRVKMSEGSKETTRRELYDAFLSLENLEDAERLVEFQFRLADTLAEAETAVREPGRYDRHSFLLRRVQDALAFRLLVPHALRQLLGSASPRAHGINAQGDAFQVTREAARRYAAEGHQVLVADLSHIIRMGDLIVCDNPFVPSVVEVKAGEVASQHVMQGRRGRQMSRSVSTIEYLEEDYGQIFGQPKRKIAVQSKESMNFNWDAVEAATLRALQQRTAVVHVSDYDVLLAVHALESNSISLEPIVEDLARFRSPFVASHAVSLLNPELLTRPPAAWPINDKSKRSLMEEELVLVHAIDMARFRDPLEEDFLVLEVSHESGFSTERLGERGTASARFIDEVMFGYATIESVVAAMRELHDLTKAALESRPTEVPSQYAPKAVAVESHELRPFERPAVLMDTKNARYRIDRDASQ